MLPMPRNSNKMIQKAHFVLIVPDVNFQLDNVSNSGEAVR